MTNREIIVTLDFLIQMMDTQEEACKKEPNIKRLPAKVAFAVHKNKKKIMEEYKTYMETLDEINKRFGLKVEEGKISIESLDAEQRENYGKELTDLQSVNVEVDIHKIKEEDFGSYEPTLKELDALNFMLE